MQHIHILKVINDNSEGKLEFCVVCKKKVVTKKDPKTGRVDNKKYLKEHTADTAQPEGRTSKVFKKMWGEVNKDLRFK